MDDITVPDQNPAEQPQPEATLPVSPTPEPQPAAPAEQKSATPDFGKALMGGLKAPWKYKSLWFFGVLLAIFSAGGSFNSNTSSLNNSGLNSSNLGNVAKNIPLSTWILVGTIVSIVVVVFLLLGLIVGSWALAAIINGNVKLQNGEQITRKEIGKTGRGPVWGLIKLNFLIPMLVVLAIIVTAVIVGLLATLMGPTIGPIFGIIIAVVALISLIPFLVYFGIVWLMAGRFVVVEGQKAWQSIGSARALLKGNWWMTFLLSFVSGVISGCGSCLGASVFFIFLIATVGFAIGKLYVVAGIMGFLALVGLIIMLIVTGYFRAFTESALTIWWLDLKKIKE